MAIPTKAILELQKILECEYGYKIPLSEVQLYGEKLVRIFEIILRNTHKKGKIKEKLTRKE